MLFTSWPLQSIFLNLGHFSALLSFHGLLAISILLLIAAVSWRSTDTPTHTTPPFAPPRASNTTSTTLQLARIFSPQPYLTRLRNQIHSRPLDGANDQSPHRLDESPSPSYPSWLSRSFVNLLGLTLHLPLLFNRFLRHTRTNLPSLDRTRSTEIVESRESFRSSVNLSSINTCPIGHSESTLRDEDMSGHESQAEEQSSPNHGQLKFTVKFLNDTLLQVVTNEEENVAQFKRRHFGQELKEKKVVRLIFNGRVIDDGLSLREAGIFEDCVVHCFTVTPQQTPPPLSEGSGEVAAGHGGTTPQNLAPGFFFVALLGLILISLWCICFKFGQQLFTQSAFVSLSVLTGIFIIGLVACYLPVHPVGQRR